MIILFYFIGAYLLPVAIGFAVVKRLGRRFHEADAIGMIIPYVAYWLIWIRDDGSRFNIAWALFATGCAVVACMPLRLLRVEPWAWGSLVAVIGSLAAYVAYWSIPGEPFVLPI